MEAQPEYQLRDLIDAVCCDALPDDLVLPLDLALRKDAASRQQYFQAIALTTNIRFWLRAENSATQAINALQQMADHRPQTKSVIRPLAFARLDRWTSHSSVAAIFLAALTFYGTFALLVWTMSWRSEKSRTEELSRKVISIARVTSLNDVRWSPDLAVKEEDSSIHPGEPLRIDAGRIELKLARGVQLTMDGPAQWSIDDENAVTLHAGKLVARVPKQAIGFTVATPTTEIIDLGTEFGVDVDTIGRTDVQVLKGTVNVNYSSHVDESKSLRRSIRMTAGNAKRFAAQPDKPNAVTASEIEPWIDKTAPATKRPEQQQKQSAETKYAAAVMADRPLGYWRFSDTDGHRAVDASGHGNHGQYFGFVSTNNPGICPSTNDRSIRFLGKGYGGYVRIKDLELPASCTIELWARSASPSWNTNGWLFHCASPNGFEICPNGEGRDWHVYLVKPRVSGPRLGPHRPTNIADRFHQYVFSYDVLADRGLLYFDGMLVHEKANVYGDEPRREAARLTFYLGHADPSLGVLDDFWGEGSIDELAIYGKVLTPDAVKRHYEAAECPLSNSTNPGAKHD